VVGQGQADACSRIGTRVGAIDLAKVLEDQRLVAGGDPDAAVLHGQQAVTGSRDVRQIDREGQRLLPHDHSSVQVDPALRREFDGVGQQLVHDLAQPPPVGEDARQRRGKVAVYLQAATPGQRGDARQAFLEQG